MISVSMSATYTGRMLVPHFGGAPGVPKDEVIRSKNFFDQQLKISLKKPLKSIKMPIEIYAGIKNLFNSYQGDFDTSAYRDSNYIYGPASPRTYFFGVRIYAPD